MNRIFLVYEQIVKHYIDRIETHDLNQGRFDDLRKTSRQPFPYRAVRCAKR